MAKDIKNVFISHYGQDEEHIVKLKDLLDSKGYQLRNSSIDSTKPNDAKNEEYIKYQLLKPGIEWAGTTIVLIGPETHTRWWVDWEIEQSNDAGNRIVGVYIQGATDSDIPEALNKYGEPPVGWQSDKIIDAIEGRLKQGENPDGTPWISPYLPNRSEC